VKYFTLTAGPCRD